MKYCKDSLFICFTVYQLKLVKLIIEKKEINDHLIVYLGENNSKVRFFLSKNKFKEIVFFQYKGNKLIKYLYLYIFIRKIKLNNVKNIFIATLNAKEIKVLLSCVTFENLIGFDDGLGSILPSRKGGLYFDSDSFSVKIFFRILGLSKYKNLHNEINKFYGVYPERFYKTVDFEKIEIVNINTIYNSLPKKIKKIFIGQPYINIGIDSEKILRFLLANNIDYYLPHPAEVKKINFEKVVFTDELSEDFIVNLVKDGYEVHIYSIFSTVIFNLCNIDNVFCYSLYNDELISKYADVYNLVDNFSINKLKID